MCENSTLLRMVSLAVKHEVSLRRFLIFQAEVNVDYGWIQAQRSVAKTEMNPQSL